ncbi:hypothetical protein KIPB_017284, partial [Kipferlia bialata]
RQFPSVHALIDEVAECQPARLCGANLSREEWAFHCSTCSVDDTSVLCAKCFRPELHEGHDF